MLIYIVRHGETNWNREGWMQGQEDIPLNEAGIAQAAAAAEKLHKIPFEIAFTSPLSRARETAKILIGDRDISLIEDARLKEINFGNREGSQISRMKADPSDPLYNFFEHPERYCPPETAESYESLFNRSAQFLREKIIPLEKKYDCVLIVAHGALIKSIINPIAGIPLEDFWKKKMGNCAVSTLFLEQGRFRIDGLMEKI